MKMMRKLLWALGCFCAMVLVTRIALQFEALVNPTTVGFCFVILVVLSAVFAGLAVGIATSISATLFFNYFFFQPVGTFHIAALDDSVAVFALLFTAIVISRLTASARENSRKVHVMDLTLEKLREFGRWMLAVPHDLLSLSGIAESVVKIFSLEYCSIHVYAEGKWHHFSGASFGEVPQDLAENLTNREDHPTDVMELIEEQSLGVKYSQIRAGSESFALLAVKSKYLPIEAVDSIASMIGVLLREILQEIPQTSGHEGHQPSV